MPSVTEPHEDPAAQPASKPATAQRQAGVADRDMGAALRSIYQRTVDENVPDDLTSLLGKLN